MSARVCMVTGSNRGLGRATAKGLTSLGADVTLFCRDRTRGETALAEVRREATGPVDLLVGDLSDLGSVRRAAHEFLSSHERLDVLVNNAATFTRRRTVTRDGLELMFATNHLGPFLLTNLLLNALKAGAPARVINVSAPSRTKLDFDDLQSERFSPLTAFGRSKMANLLFTYELARRLKADRVTANVFYPGLLISGLMREASLPIRWLVRLGSRPPERAAQALVRIATAPEFDHTTGRFFKQVNEGDSAPYSRNPEVQHRLWQASTRLAGLDTSHVETG